MENDSGIEIRELRVDGGATINNLLMQFQADLLQADVVRPKITETTALGAAYLAGLAVGYWKDIKEIRNQWQAGTVFNPGMGAEEREVLIKEWNKSIKAALSWAASSWDGNRHLDAN
jgi:glycerol kinase